MYSGTPHYKTIPSIQITLCVWLYTCCGRDHLRFGSIPSMAMTLHVRLYTLHGDDSTCLALYPPWRWLYMFGSIPSMVMTLNVWLYILHGDDSTCSALYPPWRWLYMFGSIPSMAMTLLVWLDTLHGNYTVSGFIPSMEILHVSGSITSIGDDPVWFYTLHWRSPCSIPSMAIFHVSDSISSISDHSVWFYTLHGDIPVSGSIPSMAITDIIFTVESKYSALELACQILLFLQ